MDLYTLSFHFSVTLNSTTSSELLWTQGLRTKTKPSSKCFGPTSFEAVLSTDGESKTLGLGTVLSSRIAANAQLEALTFLVGKPGGACV